MDWIYLASAIFGGSFLIPMVLGGMASEVGVDVDTDFDADSDIAADSGHHVPDGIGQGVSAADAVVGSLLSFRSFVFFAAFFGITGLLVGLFDYNFVVTLLTALVLGAVAAVANSAAFGLLNASESSSHVSERSYLGRQGVVTVPITGATRGRIRVDMGGQPQYLVAAGLSDDDHFPVGHPVAVVQLENGTALVASLKAELDQLDAQLDATGQVGSPTVIEITDQSQTHSTSQNSETISEQTQNEEG